MSRASAYFTAVSLIEWKHIFHYDLDIYQFLPVLSGARLCLSAIDKGKQNLKKLPLWNGQYQPSCNWGLELGSMVHIPQTCLTGSCKNKLFW